MSIYILPSKYIIIQEAAQGFLSTKIRVEEKRQSRKLQLKGTTQNRSSKHTDHFGSPIFPLSKTQAWENKNSLSGYANCEEPQHGNHRHVPTYCRTQVDQKGRHSMNFPTDPQKKNNNNNKMNFPEDVTYISFFKKFNQKCMSNQVASTN